MSTQGGSKKPLSAHEGDAKSLLADDSCAVAFEESDGKDDANGMHEMVEVKLESAHVGPAYEHDTNPALANNKHRHAHATHASDDACSAQETTAGDANRPAHTGHHAHAHVQHEALSMAGVMSHPSFIACAVLALVFAGCMWVPYIYLPAFQYDALGIPLKEGAQVWIDSLCVCTYVYMYGI